MAPSTYGTSHARGGAAEWSLFIGLDGSGKPRNSTGCSSTPKYRGNRLRRPAPGRAVWRLTADSRGGAKEDASEHSEASDW